MADFSPYDFTAVYFVDAVFTSDCACGAFLLFAEFGCSHRTLHLKWEERAFPVLQFWSSSRQSGRDLRQSDRHPVPSPCHWNWMAFKVPSNRSHSVIQWFLGFGNQWRGGWQRGCPRGDGWMTPFFAWCTVQELGLIVKLRMQTEAGEPSLLPICIAHFTYRRSFNSFYAFEMQCSEGNLSCLCRYLRRRAANKLHFMLLKNKISWWCKLQVTNWANFVTSLNSKIFIPNYG